MRFFKILGFLVAFTLGALLPCLAKEAETSPPDGVRFWVSSTGDVFLEEMRHESGFFSGKTIKTTGVLMRLRWPPTVIYAELENEPIIPNYDASFHFIGGERFLAVTQQKKGRMSSASCSGMAFGARGACWPRWRR